jgi:hypothetical protein
MRLRFFLALPLCFAVVSVCAAGHPTGRYSIYYEYKVDGDRQQKYLAAWKGQLTTEAVPYEAKSDDADHPSRWYIDGSRIKCSVGGAYLAYDPARKNKKVLVASKPGKGTDWVIDGLANDQRREEVRGVIRVGSGPMKGWYLGVEEVKEKDRRGKTVIVRRIVLAPKPKQKVEVRRIWR